MQTVLNPTKKMQALFIHIQVIKHCLIIQKIHALLIHKKIKQARLNIINKIQALFYHTKIMNALLILIKKIQALLHTIKYNKHCTIL